MSVVLPTNSTSELREERLYFIDDKQVDDHMLRDPLKTINLNDACVIVFEIDDTLDVLIAPCS
jgi:hypothetical protein